MYAERTNGRVIALVLMRATDPFEYFPGLKRSVLFVFKHALEIAEKRLEKMDAEYGITIRELWILMASDERETTQGLLAESLGINKNVMVKIVDLAEEKGIIKREVDRTNRRANRIRATPKGRRILRAVMSNQEQAITEAFKPLSLETVMQVLEYAMEIIDGHHKKLARRKK